jgi:prevent-host-death family protein
MRKAWQVQDAKARFSEFLEASISEGPQVVTKRGVEAAVLIPIEQWRRLENMTKPNLKDLLLAPEARSDALTPPRKKHRHRAAPTFE